ncbi:hypothetical protein EJB05_27710, partial [Eragrostis curvula]
MEDEVSWAIGSDGELKAPSSMKNTILQPLLCLVVVLPWPWMWASENFIFGDIHLDIGSDDWIGDGFGGGNFILFACGRVELQFPVEGENYGGGCEIGVLASVAYPSRMVILDEDSEDGELHSHVQVGVIKDDKRGLAAEL